MRKERDIDFSDHLKELRRRFVFSLVYFIIMLIISFYFSSQIVSFIRNTSSGMQIDLNMFSVTDSLYIYMRVSTLSALILSMPFFLWQLWRFVKPGLKKNEIGFVRRYLPIVFMLFLAGTTFAYYVIIPYYVMFSTSLAQSNGLASVIGAKEYIDFVVKTVWPFGLAFEMPMLMHILSVIGIVNHKLLIAMRGYAYVGLMVISAFLTPPDPVSMGIMLIPLSILFESSVWIAKRNERKRKLKHA